MKARKIVFASPFKVEVQEEEIDLSRVPSGKVVLKNVCTLISPGTDMACLAGVESWFKLPGVPGYTAVGEVVALGEGVRGLTPGDLVYHSGNNREYLTVSDTELLLKVPAGLDPRLVPFTRMATIAMTAIRVVPVELGDVVAVTGLGLVGNFAVQLAKLAGATVIGIDPSASRRELARQCGADYVIDPMNENATEKVMELTEGQGVNALIEASGMSQVLATGLPLVTVNGDAVLLGSPRADFVTNITPLYRQSHDGRYVNIKGGTEWRYPVKQEKFVKHSIERNARIVLNLMTAGKLRVEPLMTHVFKPEEAPDAYEKVRTDKEHYLGVVFDWR